MLKGHALAFWKPPQSIVRSRQRVNAHWQRWFQTYCHSDLHLFYFFIIIIRLHFHLGVSFHFFRIAPCFIARSPSRRELQKSKPTAAARARPFFLVVVPNRFGLIAWRMDLKCKLVLFIYFVFFLEDCIVDAQEKREMDITAIGWKKRNKVVTNEKKTIIKQWGTRRFCIFFFCVRAMSIFKAVLKVTRHVKHQLRWMKI